MTGNTLDIKLTSLHHTHPSQDPTLPFPSHNSTHLPTSRPSHLTHPPHSQYPPPHSPSSSTPDSSPCPPNHSTPRSSQHCSFASSRGSPEHQGKSSAPSSEIRNRARLKATPRPQRPKAAVMGRGQRAWKSSCRRGWGGLVCAGWWARWTRRGARRRWELRCRGSGLLGRWLGIGVVWRRGRRS